MPNDPNMPGGPGGGGGGQNPPFDPNIANVFDRMATAMDIANEKAANSEKLLQAMAEHAGAVAENAEEATKKMRDFFRVSDNIEDNYKRIVDYAKKRGQLSKKDLDDAKKARKELSALADMYKAALATAKKNTKETDAMRHNLKMIETTMKGLKTEGKLVGAEWQKVADVFDQASRNAKNLAVAAAQLGKTGAALKGMSGILGSMGIGKGFSSKIERRLEQIEEVKSKVKESKELRQAATKKHMVEKRAKAVDEIKAKSKTFGFGDTVDPETGEVTTDAGRDMLARKMGFKRGSKKYTDFISGEAAGGAEGGAAAAGEAGAGWMATMTEGGGAIEMLATVIEEGVAGLTALAPEIMIPLEILIAAITLLTEAFGAYVKQNKEMEAKIGKGGLFTEGGVGAGEAFARARQALNPNFGLGTTELGITQERNLAIAGAMTNAGYNVNSSFGPGAGNAANMAPGAQGEFMKGGVGEMQRIVMGAGRVGGMTDEEGVATVIKLLDKYRETMAGSEMFLTKINKDTQAAGISTTKYLQIVDDVSGAFSKMSQSLEQVTGVMKELSRYGSLSSENLKDMMEFLEKNQQGATLGTLPEAAYTYGSMSNKQREGMRAGEHKITENYISGLNEQLKRAGIAPLDMSDFAGRGAKGALTNKDFEAMQSKANSLRTAISNAPDDTTRKQLTTALAKVQDQIAREHGTYGDSLSIAASASMGREDPLMKMTRMFQNLNNAAGGSQERLKQLLGTGGGSATEKIYFQQFADMFHLKSPEDATNMLRTTATNRVNEAMAGNPSDQKKSFKLMATELDRNMKSKGGWNVALTSKGYGGFIGKTLDETFNNLMADGKGAARMQALMNDNLDDIAFDGETQKKLLDANLDGNDTDDKALSAQLSQARGVAMRTQTVGELLSNTFKPLLISLLSEVEKIATWIAKHFGGDNAKDQAQTMKDMAALPDAINAYGDKAEALMKDPTKAKEAKAALDAMTYLQGIQEHGMLAPDDQAKVEGLLGTGTPMTRGDLIGSTMSAAGPGGQLAGAATSYVYNIYDAHFNQHMTNDGSVGTSPERPKDQQGSSAALKPAGAK